jgi:hypothetical protein
MNFASARAKITGLCAIVFLAALVTGFFFSAPGVLVPSDGRERSAPWISRTAAFSDCTAPEIRTGKTGEAPRTQAQSVRLAAQLHVQNGVPEPAGAPLIGTTKISKITVKNAIPLKLLA